MHLLLHYLKDFATFTIGYVFIRLLSRWAGAWIYKKLLSSERDIAIWQHYKKRASGKGHAHHSPILCIDEDCGIVKPVFTHSRLARRSKS